MKRCSYLFLFYCTFFSISAKAQWSTSGTSIYYNTGNVGIGPGITAPGTTLDVGGNITFGVAGTNRYILNAYPGSHDVSILSASFNAGFGLWVGLSTGYTARQYGINAPNAPTGGVGNKLSFYAAGAEYMALTSTGNVGIGTTDNGTWTLATAPNKLSVGGGIEATAMTLKLTSAWPDYVFKQAYHLPSIIELKNYIDVNQHLPDMPTAADISGNGLNLGDINTLLVKKVEELTLYLIDENKKRKEVEAQTLSQKEQLENQAIFLKKQEERLAQLEKQVFALSSKGANN